MIRNDEDLGEDGKINEVVSTPILKPDKNAGGEEELQVEIVDDTPPEDKNRPRRTGEPDIPDDDEVAQYSEKVKKRISKLKFEFHEERRKAEELERQQIALADYTKRAIAENNTLKKALQSGQVIIADQMKGRVETQLESAKHLYKQAIELGDIDKQVQAQADIARLSVEAEKVRSFTPSRIEEPEQIPDYVPQAPAPKPSERALSWAQKNKWFGSDKLLTDYAKHIHDRLVVFDRVDPNAEEYWEKLDGEMKKRFPHVFDDGEVDSKPHRESVVVAPVKRSSNAPRSVQLSSSEVAIAKRLGLTLQQYAAEKIRSK